MDLWIRELKEEQEPGSSKKKRPHATILPCRIRGS